jgi:hypothetical protein
MITGGPGFLISPRAATGCTARALAVGRRPRWSPRGTGPHLATRDIPKMGFPFIVYAYMRSRAKRKPFLCPECGEAVQAD